LHGLLRTCARRECDEHQRGNEAKKTRARGHRPEFLSRSI
jgi:hypothetical protein